MLTQQQSLRMPSSTGPRRLAFPVFFAFMEPCRMFNQ